MLLLWGASRAKSTAGTAESRSRSTTSVARAAVPLQSATRSPSLMTSKSSSRGLSASQVSKEILCPCCHAPISETELKALWGAYTSSKRKTKGHGKSTGRPRKQDPAHPRKATQRSSASLKRESPASIAAALIARAKQIRPAASPELSGAPARTPYPPASVTDQDLNGDAGEHRKLVAFDDL